MAADTPSGKKACMLVRYRRLPDFGTVSPVPALTRHIATSIRSVRAGAFLRKARMKAGHSRRFNGMPHCTCAGMSSTSLFLMADLFPAMNRCKRARSYLHASPCKKRQLPVHQPNKVVDSREHPLVEYRRYSTGCNSLGSTLDAMGISRLRSWLRTEDPEASRIMLKR